MAAQHLARGLWAACLSLALSGFAALPAAAAPGAQDGLDNPGCLSCHDTKAHKIEVPRAGGEPQELLAVPADKFSAGLHAKMQCVACHTAITDNPAPGKGHRYASTPPAKAESCADCHKRIWDTAQRDNTAAAKPQLKAVVENTAAYLKSFHARPTKNDKSKVNATCDGCHDTHSFNIPPKDSPANAQWRLDNATTGCSDKCHGDEVEEYGSSAHGKEAIDKRNKKSAICTDCHTAHDIGNTSAAPVKLAINADCGNCHKGHYQSYKATYHGQISTLGYADTAKCFDCHGSHGVLPSKNAESKVHADNIMATCRTCHNGKKDLAEATAGFATFQAHARTDDFAKYPQMWLGFRGMVGLLVFTFAFFWLHTALWFFREFQERRQGKLHARVQAGAIPAALKGKHVQRFTAVWRIAHLVFAVSLMLLTLTGMPLFYPEAGWAPVVMHALGGPKVAGLIHRISAVVMLVIFVWHLLYMGATIWRKRKTFRWFGPDSLVPNLQDGLDIVAMFKWFLGKAPRPVFERWTYWEKFDYWAPFWGVALLAITGLMLWLPHLAAIHLPGWVFNVAALLHGEEAFLAVVFLFTVHFFNNHFRPDKFPLETVMFTGSMSLEHFRIEHPLQYERLVASGDLDKYLVNAPSAPMNLRSKLLGFALIAAGLALLAMVAVGFFGGSGH
jgi:cytochrome b subunit of formate dehydrogenase